MYLIDLYGVLHLLCWFKIKSGLSATLTAKRSLFI